MTLHVRWPTREELGIAAGGIGAAEVRTVAPAVAIGQARAAAAVLVGLTGGADGAIGAGRQDQRASRQAVGRRRGARHGQQPAAHALVATAPLSALPLLVSRVPTSVGLRATLLVALAWWMPAALAAGSATSLGWVELLDASGRLASPDRGDSCTGGTDISRSRCLHRMEAGTV